MSEAVTTRKCKNPECGEWYDARAAACYLCGTESEEYNHALKKAVETTRLNSALAFQTNVAGAEARAGQMIGTAPPGGGTPKYIGRLPVAGYNTLHTKIKNALEDSGF